MTGAAMAGLTFLSLLVFLSVSTSAIPHDSELPSDFLVPPQVNASLIDGSFFTFTGFNNGVQAPAGEFKLLKATKAEFPALTELGVSYALLEYQPKSLNPPHTHPRGTEVLYVIDGTLDVGLVATDNKLFAQTLKKGDVFVFPKGLVHFQINRSSKKVVKAIAAFSSSNPGTVSLPATLFGSGIESSVLQKAFQVEDDVIQKLKAPFAPTQ